MIRFTQIALLVLAIFTAQAHAAELKLGYVDLERALNEIEEGAQARANLKDEFEKKQQTLNDKQEAIKTKQQSLESQKTVMSADKRQEKEVAIQRDIAEVQQLYMTMQQDMASRQQQVMGQLLQKMHIVIDSIAKEGKYTFILNKNDNAVLFGLAHLDLSNELIRRYNEAYPVKSDKAALPAGSGKKTKGKNK